MMTALMSPFLIELSARGFIQQSTNLEGLDLLCRDKSLVLYVGYDASAPSLQVGNLMSIMLLRIAQRHGHTPLVVMGGATSKIGDPTWKDTQRPLLSEASIQENLETIKGVFKRYLAFEGSSNKAIMVNNDDWFKDVSYLGFLRAYGPHFSVNRMLSLDSVRMRLEREQTMSFLEFNYMILQAYDFLHLFQTYDCVLQCGGSDQWGNIVNGVDLIRRVAGREAFGLTTPLLTKSNGEKMGKTAGGAIWLNADSLSPYDYWQFWRTVDDADVIKLLKIYTDVPVSEIEDYAHLSGKALNQAKVRLADEATSLAHGPQCLALIHRTADAAFSGASPEGELTPEVSLKTVLVDPKSLEFGYPLLDILTDHGFAKSKGEARRLIRSGGCRLGGEIVQDETQALEKKDFHAGPLKVSLGKKTHFWLQLNLAAK